MQAAAASAISEEDHLRARFYALLATLLVAPPGAELLRDLARLEGDETDMGRALAALAEAAANGTPEAVEEEFNALFIGLTRGEIVPYASYYLTGFLHEKPLADLRTDLSRIGMEKAPDRAEPEDHIGFLCEVMYGFITRAYGDVDPAEERRFFEKHIDSWAGTLFTDLETAPSARFYRPVGTIGRLFLAVEREAFAMAGNPSAP